MLWEEIKSRVEQVLRKMKNMPPQTISSTRTSVFGVTVALGILWVSCSHDSATVHEGSFHGNISDLSN